MLPQLLPGPAAPCRTHSLTHPLPGLVLAVLRRHLAKALPGFQLLHGLHGPAVLLAEDVPDLQGGEGRAERGCVERDGPAGTGAENPHPPGPAAPHTHLDGIAASLRALCFALAAAAVAACERRAP